MKIINFILFFFAVCILVACSTTQPAANFSIQSAKYLNPDINGRASPVVVTIYQLKSPFAFNNANFNELDQNSEAVLGADLVDKQSIEIQPNQQHQLSIYLDHNTNFIGMTAAYRKIDMANWHQIIKLPPKRKSIELHVMLESEGVVAQLIQKKFF